MGGFARTPDFRTLFANHSRMRVGPGEVVITFGHADEIPNIGPLLTELVGIALTPTHAKTLAVILTDTLKLYEETFGAIPPPSTTLMDPKKVDEIVKKATQFDIQK
jgi:hypothetical protein